MFQEYVVVVLVPSLLSLEWSLLEHLLRAWEGQEPCCPLLRHHPKGQITLKRNKPLLSEAVGLYICIYSERNNSSPACGESTQPFTVAPFFCRLLGLCCPSYMHLLTHMGKPTKWLMDQPVRLHRTSVLRLSARPTSDETG